MRQYAENLEKQDRARAEQWARKQARAQAIGQLAQIVAGHHMKKEMDLNSKIEAEFNEQTRRSIEDEQNRKERNRQRSVDTQKTLQDQMDLKRHQEQRERDEAVRLAAAMRDQELQERQEEANRRLAARMEAKRLNDFLNTQLQLQHHRETKPVETSITRPQSCAKKMLSPTRYRPTPSPLPKQ